MSTIKTDSVSGQQQADKKVKLATLKYADLEEWRKDNEYIHEGYPRYTMDSLSPSRLMQSTGYHPLTGSWGPSWLTLFGPPHTETLNILTHLFGATIAACVFLYTFRHLALQNFFGIHPPPVFLEKQADLLRFLYPFPGYETTVTHFDSWIFPTFYLAVLTCFTCSTIFHVSLLHSESLADTLNKFDYVGIVALIVGSAYPALYYGFYCQPLWQAVYMGGMTCFGLATAYVVLSPGYATPAYRRIRMLHFLGLGLSGFIPVSHKILTSDYEQANLSMGLNWLFAGAAFYIGGGFIYAERFPESLFPGKFDIYGSSHQILHVACLFAALTHYISICKANEYCHFMKQASCSA